MTLAGRVAVAASLPHGRLALAAIADANAASSPGLGAGTTWPGVSVGASPAGMCGNRWAMPLWQSIQVFSLLAK